MYNNIPDVGDQYTNKNGEVATVIMYKNSRNVSVQFEDGEILEKQILDNLRTGIFGVYRHHKEKVGEENRATCGQLMKIIEYKNSRNITIQFEDGTVVKNKEYKAFKNGNIANPNLKDNKDTKDNLPINHIGEERIMNNGEIATIIDYIDKNNITVKFGNNSIKYQVKYLGFINKALVSKLNIKDHYTSSIGRSIILLNGKKATCIEATDVYNLTLKLDDGTILNKVTLRQFVNNTVIKEHDLRLYETIKNNKGLDIKIIRYSNSHDIDVQFKDGTVVKNRSYYEFKNGTINYPVENINLKTYRLGETKLSNCGMNMTIIRYGGTQDIDVQFEDNTIIKNKTYENFIKGAIINPKCMIGKENTNTQGLKMKIIAYRSNRDIDVEFEDGVIVTNKGYGHFCRGGIKNPKVNNDTKSTRNMTPIKIGEVSTNKNGLKMKIIAARKRDDIDIEFEDGVIKKHVNYKRFLAGSIRYKSYEEEHKERLGKKVLANNGLMAEIIEYRNSHDIDIKFENGVILKHKQYKHFIKGKIGNDNIRLSTEKFGEEAINFDGRKMKIIRYGSLSDIDIEFEDGEILEHIEYEKFERGTINFSYIAVKVGEQCRNNKGYLMTLIRYNNYYDIDVQFEDGTIVYNRQYNEFKYGSLRHPNQSKIVIEGQSFDTKPGLRATVIKYRSIIDIDVEFEDGTIVKHKRYGNVNRGLVGHPKYRKVNFEFMYNDIKYYTVYCKKCKGRHILKLPEMKDFICTGKE